MSQQAMSSPCTLSVKHISEQRLEPYLNASFNDTVRAVQLYELDRRLSAEIFYEIGIIEVALRNAVNRYLSQTYGKGWIFNPALPIDRRATENLHDAWNSLSPNFRQLDTTSGIPNGKIVGRMLAASMFRTWSNLFDKGGASGHPAPREKANHDIIWTTEAIKQVFPGAKKLAGRSGDNLDRDWVFRQIKEVHVLRNRIAHHESLINGYPMPGQENTKDSSPKRTAKEGVDACWRLAKMIDRDLAKFLKEASDARKILRRIENLTDG